jgi:hypothetical protein
MKIFLSVFLLFSQPFTFIEKDNFYNLKKYFKEIPVEISSKTLEIPTGLYGPKQGFFIIYEKKFKILEFQEIPLPNIPGRFKLFILNCQKDEKNFKAFLLFKNYKKKWVVQSFKEIP